MVKKVNIISKVFLIKILLLKNFQGFKYNLTNISIYKKK